MLYARRYSLLFLLIGLLVVNNLFAQRKTAHINPSTNAITASLSNRPTDKNTKEFSTFSISELEAQKITTFLSQYSKVQELSLSPDYILLKKKVGTFQNETVFLLTNNKELIRWIDSLTLAIEPIHNIELEKSKEEYLLEYLDNSHSFNSLFNDKPLPSFSLNALETLSNFCEDCPSANSIPIYSLSSDNLGRILSYSQQVFKQEKRILTFRDAMAFLLGFGTTTAALYQSTASTINYNYPLMDYKTIVPELLGWQRKALFEINGVLYNNHEMGNMVWGIAVEQENTFGDPSKIANKVTLARQKRPDEPNEQKAINAGERIGKSLRKKNTPEKFRAIKKAFQVYNSNGQGLADYKRMKALQMAAATTNVF